MVSVYFIICFRLFASLTRSHASNLFSILDKLVFICADHRRVFSVHLLEIFGAVANAHEKEKKQVAGKWKEEETTTTTKKMTTMTTSTTLQHNEIKCKDKLYTIANSKSGAN